MEHPRQPPELIGQSPVFLDALAHASSAAALDRPLLICGERGSGKELIAGRIHFLSPRWEGPFVKLNCAALSDELLDSELFGHEAGAFTGAAKRHAGRFERADGGTLFLDEIASASLRIQEKLLRVIEYGEYERVGGSETRVADVRIVAAANADLPAMAAAGKFRADLLDRLAFDVIAAPPLRERKGDIAVLAAHFAAGLAREFDIPFDGFTPEAMARLAAYDWPGNVRELKNAAERSFHRWIAIGNSGPVGKIVIDPFAAETASTPHPISRLTAKTPAPSAPFNLRDELNEIEKRWTIEALAASGGYQKDAAERLSLSYDQLRGLMKKHALAGGRRS
ncbi:MAG: phage shock protein operon transcriptional activator [Pseudomonadota bacterium]